MKIHAIKLREAGEGYAKGEVVRAEFHGCAVDDGVEVAHIVLLEGARTGERLTVPFKVFRFWEGKEVESENTP